MLKFIGRLSQRQRAFLRRLRDGRISSGLISYKCWFDHGRLYARWFANPFFRRNLDRMVLMAQRISETEGFIASQEARQKMAAAVRGTIELEPNELAACCSQRDQTRRDLREKRSREKVSGKKEKKKGGGPKNVLHASCAGREMEFVELMTRNGEGGFEVMGFIDEETT